MTEVHLPRVDDDDADADDAPIESGATAEAEVAPRTVITPRKPGMFGFRLILEVALIAMGVFLGLAGEQWRENARQRENAMASLRRLRSEVVTNRDAVGRVKDYHATTRTSLRAYLQQDPKTRTPSAVRVEGIQIVSFEHTAWDLALTTQALGHIDSDLAFSLSRIYNTQQGVADLSRGIAQAMYLRPPSENLDGFFAALALYYDDIVIAEPSLIKMYDEVLPRLDTAIRREDVR